MCTGEAWPSGSVYAHATPTPMTCKQLPFAMLAVASGQWQSIPGRHCMSAPTANRGGPRPASLSPHSCSILRPQPSLLLTRLIVVFPTNPGANGKRGVGARDRVREGSQPGHHRTHRTTSCISFSVGGVAVDPPRVGNTGPATPQPATETPTCQLHACLPACHRIILGIRCC